MKLPARPPPKHLDVAARTSRQVRDAAQPKVARAAQHAERVATRVAQVVTSPEAWGKSIGVDDSATSPRRFDYGSRKETLSEFDTSSRDRSGARARLFGEASKTTLSVAIGLEGEAGARSKYRDDAREQTGDGFAGARGRVFAEAGLLGGSLGGEIFAGAESYSREGDERGGQSWATYTAQASVGVRGAAIASADVLGVRAHALVEAGASYRGSAKLNTQVAGPLGVRSTTDVFAFIGARASAGAGLGATGISVGGEAFVGVKAGLEQRLALSAGGAELLGGAVRFEGWAGAGARAEANAGFDAKTGRFSLSADAGAALGIGAGVSGGVTFDGGVLVLVSREGVAGARARQG